MTKDELKPCPFCGNDAPSHEILYTDTRELHFVTCGNHDCGCDGKIMSTKKDAQEYWNKRVES